MDHGCRGLISKHFSRRGFRTFKKMAGRTTSVLMQYLELAYLIMKLNFCSSTESSTKKLKVRPWGSHFLVNLYTANFEMVLKQRNLLPKVRYVDNIFCVINRRKVSAILSLLNFQNFSIKFTCVKDGSLYIGNLSTLSVASSTRHVIPWNTNWLPFIPCCTGSVFNLFLSRKYFDKKMGYINKKTELKRYTEVVIDGLMLKHLFKRKIKEASTLSPIRKTGRAGL
jgi:hypothetical protein